MAGFIGLSLRYMVYEEFEQEQLLILLLFPVGAIVILCIMKWQNNKDWDFEPEEQYKYGDSDGRQGVQNKEADLQ